MERFPPLINASRLRVAPQTFQQPVLRLTLTAKRMIEAGESAAEQVLPQIRDWLGHIAGAVFAKGGHA